MEHQNIIEREGWQFCYENVSRENMAEAIALHKEENWEVIEFIPKGKFKVTIRFRRKKQ